MTTTGSSFLLAITALEVWGGYVDGHGINVEFDGSRLHVRPTNVIERGKLGTDHLVVPATEITWPAIKPLV